MPPDPEVTLKEFMELRFQGFEKRFDNLEEGFEKRFDNLEKKVEALENCISNDVKHVIKIWRWLGGLVITVLLALAIAWLRQRLGL